MDHDEHLRQHDAQLQHLIALNVKMVESHARLDLAIEGINKSLAVVTELRERAREDDHRNGH